ncbi:MAG: prolyl oligopeptidase family serine peptidase, partial [Actinomycetes bacterium]
TGARVALLRAPDPLSRDQGLFLLERDAGGAWAERRVETATGGEARESAAAAAMRERMRELAAGIVEYTADAELDVLVFNAAGGLWRFGGDGAAPVRVDGTDGAEAPLLSPDGRLLAYLSEGTLRVVRTDDPATVVAAIAPAGEHEMLGRPDFIAAEEMGRFVGMWWDPASHRLLFQRTDDGAVPEWTIDRPGDPAAAPARVRYPAANGPNATVALGVLDARTGAVGPITWDADAFPYLVRATWTEAGGLTIDVQSRDQRTLVTLAADTEQGTTSPRATLEDPEWVEVGNGTRAHTPGGELCRVLDAEGSRVLAMGDRIACRDVLDVSGACEAGLLVAVAPTAIDRRIALVGWDGGVEWLSDEAGIAQAWGGGDTVVVEGRGLDRPRAETRIVRGGPFTITTSAEPLEWDEAVELIEQLSDGGSSAALLLPTGYDAERDGPLPVLLDPYGGPHHRQVLAARDRFLVPQWFADQGFAVLVTDGRGTPGRGPAWERAVWRDLAGPVLDDQVEALVAVAADHPELDLSRVAIRGWSFGGYLAALAVLRRPDVFHAAVAGAPVTDWRLYDTHYSERYLGHPAADPDAYRRSSLLADAAKLERPLLLIHGLADDNVVAAHTLRLSGLLLAAGRPHNVLPLSGVTHMAAQEAVAESLLHLQLTFLRDALGLG